MNIAESVSSRIVALLFVLSSISLPKAAAQDGTFDETTVDNKFEVSLSGEFLTAGSLNLEDERLVGLKLRYFFERNRFGMGDDWHLYASTGYLTDIDNEGSAIDIFHGGIGFQYDYGYFWNHRAFVELGLGAAYVHEEISTQLIDRNATNSFGEVEMKANFGLGFRFNQTFGVKLFLNQYGDSRTAGLGFSYAF